MLAKITTATPWGVDARNVQVEVDVYNGLPQMLIVGLPDASVRESRERVGSAIKNSGFDLPFEAVVVNLAPMKPCRLEPDAQRLLDTAFERLKLSARALARIPKVGRTIADFEASDMIRAPATGEAIQHRSLDRRSDGGLPR